MLNISGAWAKFLIAYNTKTTSVLVWMLSTVIDRFNGRCRALSAVLMALRN